MDRTQVGEQLKRVLASPEFRHSERMRRFLSFVVEQSSAGAPLKEALIGVAVFDRDPSYDPRIDPIVRVEARRLRRKLEDYYAGAGADDPVTIALPKGAYVPVIARRSVSLPGGPALPTPRVLVLPLRNLDDSADAGYFSDGLTQELIHALTRLAGVQVVAWSTAARLRGLAPTEPVQQVEATAVLEGSVRRAGERVRISMQLADARSGVNLWSGAYEKPTVDLFALQQEIAQSVAATLQLRLAAQPRPPAYQAEAYDFYLRGRYEWFRRTAQSMRQSIALYERAVALDERFAPAWAGLADAYSVLADYGIEPPGEAMPKAEAAANRALELDADLAEAHVSRAFILGLGHWRWVEAEQHYRRAIDLNPSYATAHHWYGLDHLAVLGRFDEAEYHIDLALQLDPLEPILAEGRAYLALLYRDYEESLQRYEAIVQGHPHFPKGLTGLGRVHYLLGNYGEAVLWLERGRALAGDVPSILGALCQSYAGAGDQALARQWLDRLTKLAAQGRARPLPLAIAHLGLGEIDQALTQLSQAFRLRDLGLPAMNVHPIYDSLRGEPRFGELLNGMGMPAAAPG